jgi:hypothetical protein
MLVAELLIDGAFAAALVAAVASLAYLLYMTIMERRLLAAQRDSLRTGHSGASVLAVSPRTPGSQAARALWRSHTGSPAVHVGKR